MWPPVRCGFPPVRPRAPAPASARRPRRDADTGDDPAGLPCGGVLEDVACARHPEPPSAREPGAVDELLVGALPVVLEDRRDAAVAERDAQAEVILVPVAAVQLGGHVLLDERDVRIGGLAGIHALGAGVP